jgi:hypothetical protein
MRGWAVIGLAAFLAACASHQPAAPPSATPPPAGPASPSAPAGTPVTAGTIDRASVVAMVEPEIAVDPTLRAIVQPIVGGLELVCRVGRPPNSRLLTDRDLPALGLTLDGAVALARANVIAGLRPMSAVAPPVPPGQIGTISGDYAEASRLLAHDDWGSLSQAMGGHLLVAIPAADTVLYTKGGVPGALTTLAATARARMAGAQRPISDMVLRWTPEGWEVVAKATVAAPPSGS